MQTFNSFNELANACNTPAQSQMSVFNDEGNLSPEFYDFIERAEQRILGFMEDAKDEDFDFERVAERFERYMENAYSIARERFSHDEQRLAIQRLNDLNERAGEAGLGY